jgi:hypothetical protein
MFHNFNIKKTYLVLVSLAFVLGSIFLHGTYNPIKAQAFATNFQKGVNIRSRYSEDFASSGFQSTVRNMAQVGANNISLVVEYKQSGLYGTSFYAGSGTPSDNALANGINYIKSQGLKPNLKIFLESDDGQWRALINPTDRNTWFSNYTTLAKKYGQISQNNNLEIFNIGTEMGKMTMPQHNGDNTRQWQNMIRQLRQVYGGKLTYGANHGAPFAELEAIEFWGDLDYIGVSAYFTVSENEIPSVNEMVSSWSNISLRILEPLVNRYNKNIIFTEIGYRSVNKSGSAPGDWSQVRYFVEDGQANAFEALYSFFDSKSFFEGTHIWDVSSDPNYGGYGNTDYTFVNKKAQNTIKYWYTKNTSQVPVPQDPLSKLGINKNFVAIPRNVSAQTPINQKIGTQVELQNITNNNYNSIILVQIYNQSNQVVYEDVYDNQSFAPSQKKLFNSNWTPNQAGQYSIKAGIFYPNWSGTIDWFSDSIATINVQGGTPPVVSSSSSIQPSSVTTITTSSSSSTPIPTSSSSSTTTINNNLQTEIWWPGEGYSISGLQPFKALIQGKNYNDYQMFWKVDDGVLNQMYNSNDGGPHKEFLVDLNQWRWKAPNQSYQITFVSYQNGQIISQKSVNIIPN